MSSIISLCVLRKISRLIPVKTIKFFTGRYVQSRKFILMLSFLAPLVCGSAAFAGPVPDTRHPDDTDPAVQPHLTAGFWSMLSEVILKSAL